MAKKTDPMTSLPSFEKMEDILGQDISWLGTPLTGVQHLQKIIEDVNDFDELRKRLSEKLAPKTVWDVIMGKLLIKPYSWQEVAGDIKEIRRLRNDAAHMHTLTPADVRDAAKVRKSLMIKIDEANQVKDPELSYYEFPELAAITKNLGLWQANLFKNIGFTSVSPQFITEGLLPSTKIANAMQAFMPSGSEAMMTASKLLYNQQEASRKAMGAVFTQQQASQKILQSAVLQQQQAAQKIIKNAMLL